MPSIRPKRSLNVLDIIAIVRELRNIIVGRFVDKVYREENGLILRVRGEVEKYYLIFTRHRAGLTKYVVETEGRKREPILKNFVERCRIDDIYTPRIDRIIHLKLSNSMELIFELIEPMNIVLRDENNKVRWCLHKYEGKDRKIQIGVSYVPPPRNFLDLMNCSIEAYISEIERSGLSDKVRAIARAVGVPSDIVREACVRLGLGENLTRDDYVKVLEELRNIFRRVLEGNLEPVIYVDKGTRAFVNVSPIRFVIYDRDYESIGFSSFNEAVDEYFRRIELQEQERSQVSRLEAELKKLEKSILDAERLVSQYLEKAEELQRKAKLILENKYIIEELAQKLRNIWQRRRENFIEEARSIEIDGLRVINFIPQEKAIILEVHGEPVKIPLTRGLREVIEDMFSRAKELRRKADSARKALEELYRRKTELSESIERLSREFREKVTEITYGAFEWFEKFRWFVTTDNKLVIAGRDASQNESIVRRYLRKRDLFFHADIPGGAVVVLRSHMHADVTENDIYQAAKYAAAHSKAWTIGASSIDVFYVYGEQVSKEAPAGEYLARGSFMIYGERKWIRNVPLEIAIGVRVDDFEDRKIIRVLSAPPEAIRRLAEFYVILRPGRLDKNKVTSIIREKMTNYVRERYNVSPKLRPEDIIVHVPGDSTITEEGESDDTLPWDRVREIAQT
ncbi:MAG: fibronectin-binding domain-containing protein [Crenarchaeota archaeon]|nr:fibronectin-binding domain-containing protein [Thermoproteota archaeon]